ncbi:HAD family hydrolase [Paenibacillus sp. 2KB_20]|uniref:HAD family hydrolase n=1 Tax=Paenibacillus sp. 2KB_20 TaxID=3232977 RepID=UPI003F993F0E
MSHKELLEKIDNAKIVSFDIFDTVILRKIQKPVQIFDIISNHMSMGTNFETKDFSTKRQLAEQTARDNAWIENQRTEISIEEIYKEFRVLTDLDDGKCNELLTLEISLESLFCAANPYMKKIYDYCLENGKEVVFSSDMYLSYEVIRTILYDNGYTNFRKLYLSSKLNKTKSTGEMYNHIVSDLSVQPKDILHIGDNHQSDIVQASNKGLETYYYKKCLDYEKKNTRSDVDQGVLANIIKGIMNNKIYSDRSDIREDFWYSFGFQSVGILYVSFIQWLSKQLKKDEIESVYFLSRDGYVMKKVYDALHNNTENTVPSNYLYASRRAFNFASITGIDEETINFLCSGTSRLKVKEFLKRINIDYTAVNEVIKKVGFPDAEHIVDSGKDYAMLRDLYSELANLISSNALKEKELLIKYLDQESFFDHKKVAIVDIGWHGSMQYSLEKMLADVKDKPVIHGYYFGTYEQADKYINNGLNIQGFLCNLSKPYEHYSIIKLCVEIFEFIFGAPHGSVVKFEQHSGKIKPILDDNDMNDGKMKKLNSMHEGALEFVLEIAPLLNGLNINIDTELAVQPLKRILENPTKEEAEKLGDIEHAEGFGNIYVKRYIAKPSSKLLIFKPKQLIREYRNSFWRKGYLKRFFRKI